MEIISLTQIGLYNPRRQSGELTEKLFVIRQKQFETLMEAICDEAENSIPQHHIIIAQRGMGKTTLLHRIAIELQKPEYNNRFIPLSFSEEPYNVINLCDFWLNSLDALADSLECYDEQMALNIDNQIKELSGRKDLDETASQASRFLLTTCQKISKRPVFLIDNIGLLFHTLGKNDQHILRSILSENGAPIVIGAGVVIMPAQISRIADSTPYIMNYDEPFYDYFQIHYLKKLSYEEFQGLFINLSKVTQSDVNVIYRQTARLKTLHQLTGGNPRTVVMLFKLIVKGFSAEINDDLEALLDEITPLYKSRYEELPEQQQKIVALIALNWEAISLNNLSQQTGYANHQLSPQLKRLVEEGWIETTPAEKAKGNAYLISERFFNIWFLMRNSTRRYKQGVSLLTNFLESFYGSDLKEKDRFKSIECLLQEAIFELQNRNEGIAKDFLYEALQGIQNELPEKTLLNWFFFAAFCLNINYGKWFLDILHEKGFDKILAPYFVAIQAIEIERKENKEKSEIYLRNRAPEISEPAGLIIEIITELIEQ